MAKYIVHVSGKVASNRHRNMEIWARSIEEAKMKAKTAFMKDQEKRGDVIECNVDAVGLESDIK